MSGPAESPPAGPAPDPMAPPPMPRAHSNHRTMIIVIGGLIVVNSIGYLAYRSIKSGKGEDAVAVTAAEPAGSSEAAAAKSPTDSAESRAAAESEPPAAGAAETPPAAVAEDRSPDPSATPSVTTPPDPAAGAASAQPAAAVGIVEDGNAAVIRAHRAVGLKAVEDGNFDYAIENFQKAIELGGSGDIPRLLSIAEEGRDRVKQAAAAPTPRPPAGAASKAAVLRGPDDRAEQAKVRDCYTKHAKQQEGADGRVRLELVIKPSGKVGSILVDAPSVRGEAFKRCVANLARTWRYPPAASESRVSYPMRFVQSP